MITKYKEYKNKYLSDDSEISKKVLVKSIEIIITFKYLLLLYPKYKLTKHKSKIESHKI